GVAERPSCAGRTVGKPLAEPVRPETPVLLVDCPLVDATAAFRARDVLFADGPEVGCAHRQGLGIAPSEIGRMNARLEPLCLAAPPQKFVWKPLRRLLTIEGGRPWKRASESLS